jgi:NAD(P)-dependent dehydrogenase (short-subunit alcohol dehydrogenase family)
MRQVSGRVAVVLGAASGVGRALATRFAAEGMRWVLAERRSEWTSAVAGSPMEHAAPQPWMGDELMTVTDAFSVRAVPGELKYLAPESKAFRRFTASGRA